MPTKTLFIAAAAISTLLAATASASAAPAPEASNPESTQNWGLGAGGGLSLFGSGAGLAPSGASMASQGGLGGLAGYYGGASAPSVAVFVERRIGHGWLLLAADLGYRSQDSTSASGVWVADTDGSSVFANGLTGNSWHASVSAGWRYVHNPADRVQLSTYGLLSAGHSAAESDATADAEAADPERSWHMKSTSTSVGATLGITVDARVTDSIALRIATPLLATSRAGSDSEITEKGKAGAASSSRDTSVGLRLAPTLMVRLGF